MFRSLFAMAVCFAVSGTVLAGDKDSTAAKAKAKAKACAILALSDAETDRLVKQDVSSRPADPATDRSAKHDVPSPSMAKAEMKKSGPREKFIIVSATWCVPCQEMKAKELPALKKAFAVEEVDGDQVKSFAVSSYPTVIFERDGHEVWRVSGYTSAETLKTLAREK